MPSPELVGLDVHLVPRRVAHYHVESRTVAEEDLGEGDRKVERVHATGDLAGVIRIRLEHLLDR